MQLIELDLDNVTTVQNGHRTICGEDCYLFRLGLALLECFDRFTPTRFLIVVDLPQVQYLPLHYPIPRRAAVLHNAPVTMNFTVLATGLGA